MSPPIISSIGKEGPTCPFMKKASQSRGNKSPSKVGSTQTLQIRIFRQPATCDLQCIYSKTNGQLIPNCMGFILSRAGAYAHPSVHLSELLSVGPVSLSSLPLRLHLKPVNQRFSSASHLGHCFVNSDYICFL